MRLRRWTSLVGVWLWTLTARDAGRVPVRAAEPAAPAADGTGAALADEFSLAAVNLSSDGVVAENGSVLSLGATLAGRCANAEYSMVVGPLSGMPTSRALPGDVDGDGDIDLGDFAGFAPCMDGPASTPIARPHAGGCPAPVDLDADGDADLHDFALFALTLSALP